MLQYIQAIERVAQVGRINELLVDLAVAEAARRSVDYARMAELLEELLGLTGQQADQAVADYHRQRIRYMTRESIARHAVELPDDEDLPVRPSRPVRQQRISRRRGRRR